LTHLVLSADGEKNMKTCKQCQEFNYRGLPAASLLEFNTFCYVLWILYILLQ